MSLFPCYSNSKKESKDDENSLSWLKNESCPSEKILFDPSKDSSIKSFSANINLDKGVSEDSSCSSAIESSTVDNPEYIETVDNPEYIENGKEKSNSKGSKKKSVKKSKHKKKHKLHSKSKHKSKSKYSEKKKNINSGILEYVPKSIFVTSNFIFYKPEEIIYLDSQGDKNYLTANSTHYTELGRYSLIRKTPLGVRKQRKKIRNEKRYFVKSSRSLLFADSLLVKKQFESFDTDNKIYIPLNIGVSYSENNMKMNTNSSRELSKSNPLGILDQATECYSLGIQNHNTNLEYEEPRDVEREYWQDRMKDYNERLSKDPLNVSLWMEFVHIQDKAFTFLFHDSDEKNHKKRQKMNSKLLAERKISILDKAILKNRVAIDLHLERILIGEDIWDQKNIKIEWNRILHSFPNKIKIWYKYLLFVQTHFASFTLGEVLEAYVRCTQVLIGMRDRTFLTHKPPEHIGYHLINIMVNLASFFYKSGYMERAIALFQALIEFNLNCPNHLKSENVSFKERLEIFEVFWETRAPRFGEENSLGWSKVMEKRELTKFEEIILEGVSDKEDDILSNGGSREHLWIKLESFREENHWLPWQQDPDDCEDPERLVKFDEIKDHIFLLDKSEEIVFLIIKFVEFLGVNIPTDIMKKYDKLDDIIETCEDGFTSAKLETLKCFLNNSHIDVDSESKISLKFNGLGPSLDKESSSFFEFSKRVIYQVIPLFNVRFKSTFAILLLNLFREKCSYLISIKNEEYVNKLMKEVKKLFKMTEFRNDINLYYEFAILKQSLGKIEDASNIHKMALTALSEPLFESNVPENEYLFKHSIQFIKNEICLCLASGNNLHLKIISEHIQKAMHLNSSNSYEEALLTIAYKLANIIKIEIRKLNIDIMEHFQINKFVSIIFMLSITTLLTDGFESSQFVYKNNIMLLMRREGFATSKIVLRILEKLYEDYTWLVTTVPGLKLLGTNRIILPIPKNSIRQILFEALKIAPRNLSFMRMIMECQNWQDIFGGSTLENLLIDNVICNIFKLLPHVNKIMDLIQKIDEGSNYSSGYYLLHVLENNVTLTNGQHCPLLWRVYLRITAIMKSEKHVKDLAYRAINGCPGAKCIYLDCVRLVPSMLPDILRLMEEKGLRIRIPLEELDVLMQEEEEMETSDTEYKENLDNECLSKETGNVFEMTDN